MFNKKILIGLLLALSAVLYGCGGTTEPQDEALVVAVSIPPQETFVEKVAGDLVEVVGVIPPGNNPENYQASPQEIVALSKASLYFAIGVETEKAGLLERLTDLNPDMALIHQDQVVDQAYAPIYFEEDGLTGEGEDHDADEDHSHQGRDPHIWMSPKRVKIMVENIRDELSAIDPENREIYHANAQAYLQELDDVDAEMRLAMEDLESKTFLIYHPSMGYFAQDYGLTMVAIESEGKEATAARLRSVIDFAREQGIKVVFYQQEHDKNQAETIASELGGEVVELAPLDPDYIENLRMIKDAFVQVLD